MKAWLLVLLAAAGSARADELSGPGRITLASFSWGTFFYEPQKLGTARLESSGNDFRLTTAEGAVTLQGSRLMGYRLGWGREELTVQESLDGVRIESGRQSWTLRTTNGHLTLGTPTGTVEMDRRANTFTLTGPRGTVRVTAGPGDLRIESPLGTTLLSDRAGLRTFSGPPLEQIPYLGWGFTIPFHGLGIWVNVLKAFPMPEVAGWLEWKPVRVE